MRKLLFFILIAMTGYLLFSNCSNKAKYESMVEAGLESGERHDTLFLGLYLGMTSEEFYKKCWDMNKEGLIRQGMGNTSVLYEMNDEFKSSVDANFYPTFFEDRIYEMPVRFQYKAWAPWNKQFSADTLQVELVDLYSQWYGTGFMKIKHQMKGDAYVKVDGNRRISIYKDDSMEGSVWALYTDLSVAEKATSEKNKSAQ